jgi:hypothetical protein
MLGILGGRVYDPRNGKDGEIGDIWVRDGRVVACDEAPGLLPAVRWVRICRPAAVRCCLGGLGATGPIEGAGLPDGGPRRYVGDLGSGGRGEVLIRDQSQ